MDAIEVYELESEEILENMSRFRTLLVNVILADNPASYMNSLDPNSVRSYWEEMADSLSKGKTTAFSALIGDGLFGVVEARVDPRVIAACGCRVKKLLVDPRFRTEQLTAALLGAVDSEAKSAGTHRDLYLFRMKTGIEPEPDPPVSRAGRHFAEAKSGDRSLPRKKRGFVVKDQITLVPVRNLDISIDFYQNRLGLRSFWFRYTGVFFYTEGGMLVLRAVDAVRSLPWPIVEWPVPDVYKTVIDLRERDVSFVPNGLYDEDRFGVFAFPGDGKGAVIRDPDGNLLAIREPARRK